VIQSSRPADGLFQARLRDHATIADQHTRSSAKRSLSLASGAQRRRIADIAFEHSTATGQPSCAQKPEHDLQLAGLAVRL